MYYVLIKSDQRKHRVKLSPFSCASVYGAADRAGSRTLQLAVESGDREQEKSRKKVMRKEGKRRIGAHSTLTPPPAT